MLKPALCGHAASGAAELDLVLAIIVLAEEEQDMYRGGRCR
jgi:hypothetical protein